MRRGLAIALWTCVLGSACSEPSSLLVTVGVKEPAVNTVALSALHEDGRLVFDCQLRRGEPTPASCGLEAPDRSWDEGDEFSLIFYGSLGSKLRVEAVGLGDGEVVFSSTGANAALPAASGQQGELRLDLAARTEERMRCSIEIAQSRLPLAARALSLLRSALGGPQEIVAAAGERVARISYKKEAGSCRLQVEAGALCIVAKDGLVLGDVHRENGPEVVAVCEPPAAGGVSQFSVLDLSGAAGSPRFSVSLNARARSSPPVLVQADTDPELELAAVIFEQTGLSLALWNVGTPALSAIALGGRMGQVPAAAPAVVPDLPLDRLLISAPPVSGVISLRPGALEALPFAADARVLYGPSVFVRKTEPPVGAVIGTREFAFFSLTSPASTLAQGALPLALTLPDVAQGQVVFAELNGEVSALLGVDGAVRNIGPEAALSPSVLTLDPSRPDGLMLLRTAELDGKGAPELLAITGGGSADQLLGASATGQSLPGFPLAIGSQGTPKELMIADLDGDTSAEIIVLSEQRLEVITLGPHSYTTSALAWPMSRHDPSGSSALILE